MADFINPYTFVPFPHRDVALDRRNPAGHAKPERDAWHGALECELEALSRLLVRWPGEGSRQYGAPSRTLPDGSSRYLLPGSSLHGGIRSLHEVLAGGCLRILDDSFVPSYRDQMRAGGHGEWLLGVVDEVDGKGRPTKVRLADMLPYLPTRGWKDKAPRAGGFWVRVCPGGIPPGQTTGDRVDIRLGTTPISDMKHRPEFAQAPAVKNPQADWVVLLTDPGARQGRGYFATVGKLGIRTATVLDDAWTAYQTAAAGTDDYREINKKRGEKGLKDLTFAETTGPEPIEVVHDGTHIGYRHAIYPFLHRDQVVWVQTSHEKGRYTVTSMKASWFWRHGGKYAAGDRVPADLKPCREWDRLCPSCRLFGSADTGGREQNEQAWQASYRGHVRVHDAQAMGGVGVESLNLAPMGAPRPGAGQFYLSTGGNLRGEEAALPLREWGAQPDESGPHRRLMRGRKMYWRTTERPTRRRFEARSHQTDHEMSTIAQVFSPGSRFRVRITFENLTRAEVGALIAAVDPGRLFRRASNPAGAALADVTRPPDRHATADEFAIPVGGGKPFGFGSCAARELRVHRVQPAVRYSSSNANASTALTGEDLDDLVDAFIDDRRERSPWLAEQWAHLSRALRVDHVDPSIVWYPPGADWSTFDTAQALSDEQRRKLEKAFDEPFAFFQRSIGWARGEERYPLTELPRVDEDDQRLGIVT